MVSYTQNVRNLKLTPILVLQNEVVEAISNKEKVDMFVGVVQAVYSSRGLGTERVMKRSKLM